MRALLYSLPLAGAQMVFQDAAEEHTLREVEESLVAQATAQITAIEDGPAITSPTLCDANVKQHAGYVDASSGNKYFFWLFESRSAPSTDPLVLWLNGGPGCSSVLGLFSENGPCKVNSDGATTTPNPHSWNENANVIYVDQPAGTGFSTGSSLSHNEADVSKNMVAFLQNFYQQLPQYKANKFFIFGESYAGHYVPAISHAIFTDKTSAFKVPLEGIGIGNGLVDPEEQYKWYAQMGLDGGKAQGGTLEKGVLTSKITQGIMKAAIGPCTALIKKCNAGGVGSCTAAYATCNYGELIPYQLTGMNPYDMRIKCAVKPLCYDFSMIDTYLKRADVKQALGVTKTWSECNRAVNMMFQGDWMKNYHTLIPDMLAGGIRVLVYAGDVDYICNWLGNKEWTLAMEWPHQADYAKAADAAWMVDGKQAGRLRTQSGFQFLQVYQAGHMVPLDQPEAALQMVTDFTQGKLAAQTEVVV